MYHAPSSSPSAPRGGSGEPIETFSDHDIAAASAMHVGQLTDQLNTLTLLLSRQRGGLAAFPSDDPVWQATGAGAQVIAMAMTEAQVWLTRAQHLLTPPASDEPPHVRQIR